MDVVRLLRPAEIAWRIVEHTALHEWRGTTLRFALHEDGPDACVVAFRHLGLSPRLACYRDCEAGWAHFLASLKGLVEKGAGRRFGHREGRLR